MNLFTVPFAARVDQPGRHSLRVACLTLAGVMFTAFGLAGWWSSQTDGILGWQAAGVATLVCLAGAGSALVLTGIVRSPRSSVAVLFLGILLRMGVPVVAAVVLIGRGGALAEAGVVGMIVVFYLIALATETCLSLKLVQGRESPKEA